jgi:hypothetical protein
MARKEEEKNVAVNIEKLNGIIIKLQHTLQNFLLGRYWGRYDCSVYS